MGSHVTTGRQSGVHCHRDPSGPPTGLACLGNPDPGGMKVYAPVGEEAFDDVQTTEEAKAGADRREAA